MPCRVIELEDGSTMIACSRGRHEVVRCVVCGAIAAFLCDYEIEPGKTCDAPLCGQCRFNVGVKDYCHAHTGKLGGLHGEE